MKYQKKFIICVIFLLIVLLFYRLSYQNPNDKASVFEYIQNNKSELESFAKDIIENHKIENTSYNEWTVSYYPSTDMVQFTVSSSRFASSHNYKGFYYSPTDIPLGYQGTDLEFIKTETGWEWKEPKGDNVQYTEKIVENWYWFEMDF